MTFGSFDHILDICNSGVKYWLFLCSLFYDSQWRTYWFGGINSKVVGSGSNLRILIYLYWDKDMGHSEGIKVREPEKNFSDCTYR